MKPFRERRAFICTYLRGQPEHSWVDVLNADFVDAYIEHVGAKAWLTMYGANKVPSLGKDLARMAKEGSLERSRTGIEGMAGMGFPRWCWIYRLGRRDEMWKLTTTLEGE